MQADRPHIFHWMWESGIRAYAVFERGSKVPCGYFATQRRSLIALCPGLYGAGSRAFFLHISRNAFGVQSYSSLNSLLKYEEFLYPTE